MIFTALAVLGVMGSLCAADAVKKGEDNSEEEDSSMGNNSLSRYVKNDFITSKNVRGIMLDINRNLTPGSRASINTLFNYKRGGTRYPDGTEEWWENYSYQSSINLIKGDD